jgi:hypothetical protein
VIGVLPASLLVLDCVVAELAGRGLDQLPVVTQLAVAVDLVHSVPLGRAVRAPRGSGQSERTQEPPDGPHEVVSGGSAREAAPLTAGPQARRWRDGATV